MAFINRIFLIGFICVNSVHLCAQVDSSASARNLIEIKSNEIIVDINYLKIISLNNNRALLIFKNDTNKNISPSVEVTFYNKYAMKIYQAVVSLEDKSIEPNDFQSVQLSITLPDIIDKIFSGSSIKIPSDWRTLKFVEVEKIINGKIENSGYPDRGISKVVERNVDTNIEREIPKLEQNPLSGFEKKEGYNADAISSNISKLVEGAKAVPERVEGNKNSPLLQGAQANTSKSDRQKPQPSPVLQKQQVRPGISPENKFGTMNIGPTAVDARWSNYSVYLQRLIETVQIQWDRILLSSSLYPPSGTTVTVSFRMDSDGKITTIIDVKNTSTKQGKEACISAITARSPYGKWSDDMVAMLGNSQDITFTFYYQ